MNNAENEEKCRWYMERVEYYRWEQKKPWHTASQLARIDLKKEFKKK